MEILHFTADWCGPCKMMKPKIAQFKEEMGARVNVQSINVDEPHPLIDKFNVRNIPTFLFLNQDGEVFDKLVGAQPITKFTEIVTSYESQN